MAQQCVGSGDGHGMAAKWEQWDELVQKGYEVEAVQNSAVLISSWWEAWEIFQKIMKTAELKMSISEVMESQDYAYPVDGWLQDFEMELGNAGEHEKRVEYCRAVLEMFDWTYDDGSNFKAAIGEELYAAGKAEEGKEWFTNWLKQEPHNENAWSVYSWCVEDQEGAEAAYGLLRKELTGLPCTMFNSFLFERAQELARDLGKQEDLRWIEEQLKSYRNVMENKPIKKEKKIYPNDPCPCGSGKKYKKCCGKK